MKKTMILAAALAMSGTLLSAKGISPVGIDSLSFDRHGDFMVVDMDIDLSPVDVASSRGQIITPLIVSAGGDTIQLPSVGVYGHGRYINYLRSDRRPLSRGEEKTFESGDRPAVYDYTESAPYQPWMDDSQLLIRRRLYGCTNCLLDERTDTVARNREVKAPELVITDFSAMTVEPITESREGASFIDFVVNKTDINPAYRRNPDELLKIRASIDSVLSDKEVEITGIWLKGFASPESPYAHNSDLAKGRTQALKGYILDQYNLNPSIISVDFEPEDWDGLRKAVEASAIDHRSDILELIDSDLEPDAKEALIKKKYPKDYRYMLEFFYPALRHTEYKITYQVKHIDDVDKIREMMRTRPNRLTQREFHILANACEPGTDEYFEVFETAARMYPDDPVAAINTAYAAMMRKDYTSAERYLSAAGDSEDAQYARGALAFSMGEYDKARSLLQPIRNNPIAAELLKEIEVMKAAEVHHTGKIILE